MEVQASRRQESVLPLTRRSNRHETLKKSQAASIKKRTDNIASRIDAKRSKRLGVKPKPGPKKSRPGFEGKRRR